MRRAGSSGGRAAGGWSLVEMAVVLVIMAAIGLALWRFLPLAPKVAADDVAQRELAQAEQALLGHVLAYARLPAPAIENGMAVLPVDTLGLPPSLKLRYQVQPSLTVSPGDTFSPMLPPAVGAVPATPTLSAEVNGLDFCMALKGAGALSLTGMDGIPTAFALMHGGPAGHDSFAGAAFALPGSEGIGERSVLAVGPGEFASRLGCPDRVAQAHGGARAAYAAYDLAQAADEYDRFRVFAVQVADMNLDNARTSEVFAGFDVAYGVFMEALAILQEIPGFPPDPLGIATGIAAHVTAGFQLGIAIDNLVGAVADRQDAETAMGVANDQRAKAAANLTRMQTLADSTLARARQLDQEGLQP